MPKKVNFGGMLISSVQSMSILLYVQKNQFWGYVNIKCPIYEYVIINNLSTFQKNNSLNDGFSNFVYSAWLADALAINSIFFTCSCLPLYQ